MGVDVWLELEHGFLGEDVRDDLALARVFRARTSVEESASDGNEGVVEVGFERAHAMPVDDGQRVRVRDGNMVRCNAYPCAWRMSETVLNASPN